MSYRHGIRTFNFLLSICPWLDFGLLPQCPQGVWADRSFVATNPTHRQRAVLPQHMRWSFLLEWTGRPNALGRGDSETIMG